MTWISFSSLPAHTLLTFKKTRLLSLLLASLLCLPLQAFAFDDASIEVTGQSSVDVTPDQFSLTLTITERGRVPSKLKALVDKKSDSVINAAKSLAISASNISSARVNLRIVEEKPSITVQGVELKKSRQASVFIDGQDFSHQVNSTERHHKPLFELSRQISVNFNEIADYDQFLAQIIKINVSRISPLSMSIAGREEYYQQALLQAINHAKQKAQRMVKQAGGKVDKLLFIKELSTNHYRPMYAEAMLSDSSRNAHGSLIGSQTITARVLVKFSIDD